MPAGLSAATARSENTDVGRTDPIPVFTPWHEQQTMDIRHHEHQERIARIRQHEANEVGPDMPAGWYLVWAYGRIPSSIHETALHAVAHARNAYPEYLKADEEATREIREREEYEERFIRRRASAVARAVRVPTGGQKGWQERRTPKPDTEK
ncbi:hypothetical protein [Streptomyces misionensis]|uniref:hypothetical protein n=1 Tax=Streptomyces misionensis TaxID=67331 RepID=UPI00396B89B8